MFSRGYFDGGVFARAYFADAVGLTVQAGRLPRLIDFEPGQWAELGAGPFVLTGVASGVLLSQASEAAFPDRPASGGAGLAVTLSAGGEGGV